MWRYTEWDGEERLWNQMQGGSWCRDGDLGSVRKVWSRAERTGIERNRKERGVSWEKEGWTEM